MEIIDLLNKIANGEQVPKKIKFLNYEYEFNQLNKEYQRWVNGVNYGLGEDRRLDIILDYEVEILEEEKKIPGKLEILNANEHSKEVYYENYSKEEISLDIETLQIWVNQIIDYLNYLKSKGE